MPEYSRMFLQADCNLSPSRCCLHPFLLVLCRTKGTPTTFEAEEPSRCAKSAREYRAYPCRHYFRYP